MKNSILVAVLKVVVPYVVIAGLWILFSDLVLAMLVPDASIRMDWSVAKGWFFVAVTAMLLIFLLQRELQKRERNEAALRENAEQIRHQQNLLKAVTEGTNDAVYVKDLNGRYLLINSGAIRMVNKSRQEVLGRDDTALFSGADAQQIMAGDCRVRESGVTQTYEEVITIGGKIRTFSSTKGPVMDPQGRVIGLFGIARDVTEHKEREQEIERMKRLYAALSQINQCIVRVRSREELFEKICEALTEFGQCRMAWIGWVDQETKEVKVAAQSGDERGYLQSIKVYADDRPEGDGPVGRSIREARPCMCNDFAASQNAWPWREAVRQHGWAACLSTPIRFGGEVCGALVVYAREKEFFGEKQTMLIEEVAVDVSFALDHLDQEKRRQLSEASNRQLMVAIDQAEESIVFTDAAGNIRYVNGGFEKISGYARDEVLGKNPRVLKSGKQNADFYKQMWDTLTRGEVWHGRFSNRRKSGQLFEEEATISPIRSAEGKITSYVAVKRDITRELQLERQFIEAQKLDAIGQLAGGVAHDYNNILAADMMQLGMLMSEPGLNQDMQEGLEALKKGADRAAKLTRQLLMFSRRQAMQKKPVEMNNLLDEELKMLRRLLGEHIELLIQNRVGDAWVEADPGMMEQVIMNLCINARDAMPNGGQLTMGIKVLEVDAANPNFEARSGKFVCLSVADVGCGMNAETMERVFEPFFTTKEVGKGTGLGLATVYGIAKQHDGWVEVSSEVGKGSEFRVYIPVSKFAAPAATVAPKPKIIRGTETILVVEDEESLRKSVVMCLTFAGYRVFEAANGPEALKVWGEKTDQIHLMLTDMVMPDGMNGLELAEAFKRLKPALPVIVISGYSDEIIRSGIPTKTGFMYLPKPCDPSVLSAAVRKLLDEL